MLPLERGFCFVSFSQLSQRLYISAIIIRVLANQNSRSKSRMVLAE